MNNPTFTISYIINYHNGGGIGHIVIHAPAYCARWSYENPSTLFVMDPDGNGSHWVELPITGGCTESRSGKRIEHEPLELHALHSNPDNVKTLNGIHVTREAELRFRSASNTGVGFEYRLVFHANRIEFIMKLCSVTPLILEQCTLGCNRESATRIVADMVFDPNPASHGIFRHPAHHACSMSERWFTPPPFCYPYRLSDSTWISVSLEPQESQMQFCRFQTITPMPEGLGFRIAYDSLPEFHGEWEVPALVFRFGALDEFDALKRYADGLVTAGKVERPHRQSAPWWRGVMVCGWHEQMRQATLHGGEGGDYCTPAVYRSHIAALDQAGIQFDILTLDDSWQKRHGLWEVDTTKWPDLRGFIEEQHDQGRRVLLWVCILPDGLPDHELYHVDQARLLDPLNPAYLQRLNDTFGQMFGSGPQDYHADGIKLDFTGILPPPGVHHAIKPLHGMEYLQAQFKAIHNAAKQAKPDCLLDFQSANPHFAGLYDITRLNDFFLPGDQAVRVMSTRARIARAVNFGALVDMDGPRHTDYFQKMHAFGNISLYLTNDDLKEPAYVDAIRAGIQQFKASQE